MRANESHALAFGINARGSQKLVLGLMALQAKIINELIFAGLVMMTLASISMARPLMHYFSKKQHFVREEEK